MSALDNAQANSEAAGWVFAMAYNITSVLKLALLSIHCYNVYHDLFTEERKSVSHRRNMPAITKKYKVITYLTLCSIAFFTCSSISGTATPFSTDDHACYRGGTTIVTFTQLGKTTMYMIFLARLYQIYQKSAYSYPFKCIAFFCVLLIIYGLGVIIFMIFVYAALVYTYGHHDYPNWCGPGESEQFAIIAAMIIFEDLCAAIGFLIAFIVPLKKTLKAIESVDNDPKVTRKILYAGTKTTVLTGVATTSTLILLFLTGAFSGAFSIPDSPVNSICMMLMSVYYPDKKYYQKLCKCCICCCDKRGTSNELEEQLNENISNENEPTRTENVSSLDTAATSTATSTATNASSVDTMSQLRIAGKDVKVTYNAGSDPEKELAEI